MHFSPLTYGETKAGETHSRSHPVCKWQYRTWTRVCQTLNPQLAKDAFIMKVSLGQGLSRVHSLQLQVNHRAAWYTRMRPLGLPLAPVLVSTTVSFRNPTNFLPARASALKWPFSFPCKEAVRSCLSSPHFVSIFCPGSDLNISDTRSLN